MDLVLFGIQGSGKGTQAQLLAKQFDYYLFEAGGELRSMAASGTDLGNEVKSYIDEGHLVPHEIIMKVVEEAIAAQPADKQILFDGIPRDEDQMKDFDKIMAASGRKFVCVQIMLEEDEAFARIQARAQKEGREDDANEEKIRRRMSTFHEKTVPVIEAYAETGQLIGIDGDGDIDEVYGRLLEALGLE